MPLIPVPGEETETSTSATIADTKVQGKRRQSSLRNDTERNSLHEAYTTYSKDRQSSGDSSRQTGLISFDSDLDLPRLPYNTSYTTQYWEQISQSLPDLIESLADEELGPLLDILSESDQGDAEDIITLSSDQQFQEPIFGKSPTSLDSRLDEITDITDSGGENVWPHDAKDRSYDSQGLSFIMTPNQGKIGRSQRVVVETTFDLIQDDVPDLHHQSTGSYDTATTSNTVTQDAEPASQNTSQTDHVANSYSVEDLEEINRYICIFLNLDKF